VQAHRIRINAKVGEWHYLTPISDAHLDSASCDVKELRRLLDERAKLPNHRLISLGDLGDWILPKDMARYQPGVAQPQLRGIDDYINAAIAYHDEVLRNHRFDLLASGNHEAAVLRHHGIDLTRLLAERMGAGHGGYCGYLIYTMMSPSGKTADLSILYHHGRWGGRVIKGFGGMRDWARMFDGWDLCLAGHNHQSVVHKETRLRPRCSRSTTTQELTHRDVYMAFCGTHMRSYHESPGSGPRYEEIAAHAPIAIGAPLVKFRLLYHNARWAREHGRPRNEVEVRFEI